MKTKHLTGSYTSGYQLHAPTTQLDIAAGAYVGGNGVFTAAGATGSYGINNAGRIVGAEVYGDHGVYLGHGGSVTNGSVASPTALIQGYGGVKIAGAAGTVTNFGRVLGMAMPGAGPAGVGVLLAHGGVVANGGNGDTSAYIQGYRGVEVYNGAGTVTNQGTIAGDHCGVLMYGGGSVTNGSRGDTSARISAELYAWPFARGVYIGGGAGTVSNYGAIVGVGRGVQLTDGGSVTNGSNGDAGALIEGAQSDGVEISGGVGTVTSFGSVSGATVGVYLGGGGSVTNGSEGDTSALIQGSADHAFGVDISGASGAVSNFGTVTAGFSVVLFDGGAVTNGSNGDTSALINGAQQGVYILDAPGTVTNHGTITGSFGVNLYLGGTVVNYGAIQASFGVSAGYVSTTLTNLGTITGYFDGGTFDGASDVMNGSRHNTSAVMSGAIQGVGQFGGGVLVNYGTITGSGNAVMCKNFRSAFGYGGVNTETITNFGSIVAAPSNYTGAYAGNGVSLLYAFTNSEITNFGTISGPGDGVRLISVASYYGVAAVTNTTVTNHGVIVGDIGVYLGSFFGPGYDANDTVTNFGTIVGTGGTSVSFDNPDNTLVVEAGSKFVGSVLGDGATLDLGSGVGVVSTAQAGGGMNETVSGSMASTLFTDFATVEASGGASFQVTGDGVIGAGQTLAADGGELTFKQAITGTGALDAGAGGTLAVDASAASSLSMAFTGAGATLDLASPSTFAAAISGFAASDVIELVGIRATGVTLGSNDVLTVKNGSATVATLQLIGSYTGDTFSVAKDEGGGTDITVNAPGAWPAVASPTTTTATPGNSNANTHAFVQAMAMYGGPPGHAKLVLNAPIYGGQGASLLTPGHLKG